MTSLWTTVVLATLAGAAIPIGAVLAKFEHIGPNWLESEFRHGVIAFGGGALLSAVALVLVPESVELLNGWLIALAMMMGGLGFGLLDVLLAKAQSSVSQLIAMLADFIPEALALGAMFAVGGKGGMLLALLIAVQNLPEGFNAYREMTAAEDPVTIHRGRKAQDMKDKKVLLMFCCLVPLGPAAGIVGHVWLAQYDAVLDFIMLFASGGILYLVFQDIAPQARLDKHWLPPMGAVLGFLFGVLGQLAIG
ncbi:MULTISPECIES: ZIP family metal transporter [unclassified Marinobacter]|uniref:ZIP family metal transporter n=1 Tax=unclassified Marinobacter TaxID=83889 RepID=UPI000BF8E9E2|nr:MULTISPECIES: divalent cation transporter [unclassified Marinobacter]PFG11669.1 ZIP family zinc transporter [Marinobacter sp. LV10MA510-1]PFG53491.1 ZIP family zinc transporter [Marinobacter sp. LV10R520-4]